MGTHLPSPKTWQSPQFSANVYCGQTARWIKMTLGMEVDLSPGKIVLDADQAPPPPRGTVPSPNFRPMSVVAKRLDGSRCHLAGGRPRPRPHCLMEIQLPSPKGHSPQFLAHVCYGQTAGWIKMPLGRELGLGCGHNVLDEDPAPPPKRGTAPNFRPMSIVTKRSPISATAEHL